MWWTCLSQDSTNFCPTSYVSRSLALTSKSQDQTRSLLASDAHRPVSSSLLNAHQQNHKFRNYERHSRLIGHRKQWQSVQHNQLPITHLSMMSVPILRCFWYKYSFLWLKVLHTRKKTSTEKRQDFEKNNCELWSFRDLHLKPDLVMWHTITYHSSTPTYMLNVIQIQKNFLWTNRQT